jgi:hypothetical protein
VSFTDAVRDPVAAAAFTITPDAAVAAAATNDTQIVLTQAPSSTAVVTVVLNGHTVSDSVGGSSTNISDTTVTASYVSGTAVTGTIAVSSNPAIGTYKGTITIREIAASDLVVNFSFTTTGKVASISTDVTTVNLAAVAHTSSTVPLSSAAVVVSLLDSTLTKTQPSTGDSVEVSVPDATNIALTTAAATTAAATKTMSATDLNSGSYTATVHVVTAVADSETVTFTPAGIMPSQGVVAKTLVATTAALGTATAVKTAVTAPTSASVIKAGATATATTADTSVSKAEFSVTGWPSGSAYKIIVTVVDASGGGLSATINDTAGLTRTLYGISTGAAIPVVVSLSGQAGSDTITVDADGGGTATAADMVVTLTAATYAVTLTTPAVTPSISKTASAIVVAGKVADSYSTPVGGATVSVSGAQTLSAGTAANLTGTATTAADGTFSVTLPAANALATSVVLTVTPVKTGISSISTASATVNLNAAGGADTMTVSLPGDEDSALTKTAATQLPAVLVPYTGRADGLSDELYVVSTGAFVNAGFDAATETCFAVSVNTSPGGQVVATGTAGVLFYTSAACTTTEAFDVSAGKATATIAASGSGNLWVTSTKTGLNTFTVTSGTVTNTYRFYAYNQIAAGDGHAMRNIGAPTTAKTAAGGIAYVTLTPTDAFGNVVKSVAQNGGTLTVKAGGGVLLDGPALSRTYSTTDADGNILIGIIAGQTESAATLTITSTSAQFGAAAGAASGTTAGTNGLTASVSTGTVAVTVGVASNTITAMIDALNAKIVALNALIAKIMRKLGVK